jgi:hypothetical protein
VQTRSSAQELATMAAELQRLVGQFRVDETATGPARLDVVRA